MYPKASNMQLLIEFFPILIFFYMFKYKGLMLATFATALIYGIQLILLKIITGKYNLMQLASLVVLVILGVISIIFKQEIFIQWKPTAIYWLLAVLFCITPLWKRDLTLLEIINKNNLVLPKNIWKLLNKLWIMFFLLMGGLNLYVVYYFDINTWVNFKLFGTMVLTVGFICLQAILIGKYLTKI